MSWRGPAYPLRAGERGLFRDEADVKLIEGNILQILGTRRGERVMLPLFGSRIMDYIHDPLDHVTCALIRFDLIEAIRMWEPRVTLDGKGTTVTPYPAEFRVVASLRYYLKTRKEAREFTVEVNRNGGVVQWQG